MLDIRTIWRRSRHLRAQAEAAIAGAIQWEYVRKHDLDRGRTVTVSETTVRRWKDDAIARVDEYLEHYNDVVIPAGRAQWGEAFNDTARTRAYFQNTPRQRGYDYNVAEW